MFYEKKLNYQNIIKRKYFCLKFFKIYEILNYIFILLFFFL